MLPQSEMAVAVLFVVIGLALLAGGGELLLRGALAFARRLHISPVIVGVTIVACATSLPELAVSVVATIGGSPDVAVGNVVGSNIFNLAAILGLSAILFAPLAVGGRSIRIDVMVMVVTSMVAIGFGADRGIGRPAGVTLLLLLGAFLWYRVRVARANPHPPPEGESHPRLLIAILLVVLGSGLLTVGADVLVRGAITLARLGGVSERVIAITLVSAGTGLPELTTSIVAGVRRHTAVAIGNVIGSNIFNVCGILGTAALVRPLTVNPTIATYDVIWLLGFSLAVLIPTWRGKMGRFDGAIMLLAYLIYVYTLFFGRGSA